MAEDETQSHAEEDTPIASLTDETQSHAEEDTPIASLSDEEAQPEIVTRDVSGDLGRLDTEEWAEQPWPADAGARGEGFRLVIRRSVMNAVHYHGQSSRDVEVCGVLVGNVYRDAAGPYASVEASIKGDFAGNSNAQVTFTAQTWDHIQGVMEREHPGQRIVGWYHTHPGFGIFLSDMDLFIHGHFFNLPWQAAMVYDPVSGEEGAFLWREGKAERGEFAVDEDAEKEIPTIPVSAEITAAALADFSRRLQGIEQRQRTNAIVLPLMLLVALAWPFVLYTVMGERKPAWSPVRGTVQPAVAATQGAGTQPVLGAPTTGAVVDADTGGQAGGTTGATTAATVVGTTQPATLPADVGVAIAPATQPEGNPQVIRPGPKTEQRGPKILENPPDKP